jgi:hypothetical protein
MTVRLKRETKKERREANEQDRRARLREKWRAAKAAQRSAKARPAQDTPVTLPLSLDMPEHDRRSR